MVFDLCGVIGAGICIGRADLGALLCAELIFCSPFLDSTLGEGVALILMFGNDISRDILVKDGPGFCLADAGAAGNGVPGTFAGVGGGIDGV